MGGPLSPPSGAPAEARHRRHEVPTRRRAPAARPPARRPGARSTRPAARGRRRRAPPAPARRRGSRRAELRQGDRPWALPRSCQPGGAGRPRRAARPRAAAAACPPMRRASRTCPSSASARRTISASSRGGRRPEARAPRPRPPRRTAAAPRARRAGRSATRPGRGPAQDRSPAGHAHGDADRDPRRDPPLGAGALCPAAARDGHPGPSLASAGAMSSARSGRSRGRGEHVSRRRAPERPRGFIGPFTRTCRSVYPPAGRALRDSPPSQSGTVGEVR